MDVLLLYVSAAGFAVSGGLMVVGIAGVGRASPWTRWAPFAFGVSIVVGVGAFVHLLVSGIH